MTVREARLGSLAEVSSGGPAPQDPSAFSSSGYPFIRAGSLGKLLAGASEDDLEKIAPSVAQKHRLKLFPPGTVLFAKSGMSATLGHIYSLRKPAYVVSHLAALVPNDPADSRFLVRLLQRFSPVSLVRDAAYPSIRLQDIQQLRVQVPTDSTERQRIADVLDRADGLRVKRRASLAQLDGLTESIFHDLSGDPTTNPNGWPIVTLATLVRADDSINYGVVQPGPHVDGGVPIVRVGDLEGGRVTHDSLKCIDPAVAASYKRSRLAGDEILVSCVGTIGEVALADESLTGFTIARAVARIPLRSDVDRVYLAAQLRTEAVRRYFVSELRTVSQPTLNIKQLSETRVTIPPRHVQDSYASRVMAIEAVQRSCRLSLAELDALFKTLQHRAFHGEL